MKTRLKNRVGIVLILMIAFVLVVGTANIALAKDESKIDVANAPTISEYEYEPISSVEENYFNNYCAFTHDVKITILDRDAYVKKGTLEKQVIKKADTTILTHGEHNEQTAVKVTGVSGLKAVKTENVTGGYKVIPIKLQLTGANKNETTIKTTVILVYAKEIVQNNDKPQQNNGNGETPQINNGGTSNSGTPATKTTPKKEAKAPVSKIEKKSDNEKENNISGIIDDGNNGDGGNGVDAMGIGLLSAAGLAAILFAISIVPDVAIIRWFNQKKALRMKF